MLPTLPPDFSSIRNSLAWKPADASFKQMIVSGDIENLAYHHALMCGLRAWAPQTPADGAEDARKMCGGHGYMMISGLIQIISSVAATCTFEGENWITWQQLATYFMKGMAADDLPADMEYLGNISVYLKTLMSSSAGTEFLSHDFQLRIFQHRAARLIREASHLLKSSNLSKAGAWNKHMMILITAARAHTEVHIVSSFIDRLSALEEGSTCDVLGHLFSLFTLTTIVSPSANNAISFVEDGYLSEERLGKIREHVNDLLDILAPDAIALSIPGTSREYG